MSSIQPPSLISFLQTPTAQRAQSVRDDAEANRAADSAHELATLDAHHDDAVEDADLQTRVNADAGGQGSLGRWSEEEGQPEPKAPPQDADAAGEERLDVRA